eukprot:1452801-Alexandrium_andersonii.AAC.1
MVAPRWNGPGYEPLASSVAREAWPSLASTISATVVLAAIAEGGAVGQLGRRTLAAPGPGAVHEAGVWLAD